MISIIAAIGKNNELGLNNDLIWHLPNDLKFFKEKTLNQNIVMGYNTFVSLGRVLPSRKHIVLSFEKVRLPLEVIQFNNLEDLNNYIKDKDVFIIGGASMYKQFIDKTDKLYLTEIDDTHKADVYFPNFDKSLFDKKILGTNSDNGINYTFTLYERK
ncbi:MAG TPA: dihydrofolate reductase [Candidatus Faecisoma merdavium]|nr:dihydrofolate reductase [Candidatus Faecisoma merdavium]